MTLALDRRATLWEDRTAVHDHTTGNRWSYTDLADLTTRLTNALAAADVGPGDAVVTLARNHVELLALSWATRRRDATLAPVSHRLPAETVGNLCARIDPTLILAEDRFTDRVPPEHSPDPFPMNPSHLTDGSDSVETSSHPRFYLHTGGTTGTPKIVVVPERQVEWNCITEAAAWGLGKHTVSPILLPMFHTGGWLLLTLPTLYVGGTVVLQRTFDPGEALAIIEDYDATQVFGVAAVFDAMADHHAFDETAFDSVEWFMSGGGPTPDHVIDAYRDRGQTFVQGYGLTEGGPNNLYMDPTRTDVHEKPDRVGRPFPDCEIRIVADDGTPVAPGTIGELEVAGPITASEYLRTADGTFEGDWVSTGDLAERDEDGDVAIVGRTDNMFVSGGENVYPEPIERVLEEHDAVHAVGVVATDHDRWGQVPKAVVVADIDEPALRTYAEDRLADHERPHTYEFVEELPQSGPGKLDRATLQAEYGQ